MDRYGLQTVPTANHMPEKPVKTRFAPSPTGFMHIGNVRTALYAYLFAKKNQGKFVLRIEDTDQARQVEGAAEQIQRTLKLAGLSWDEGPFVQTERLDIYKEKIQELLDADGAYYCFCTKEELDAARQQQKAAKQAFQYSGRCRELTRDEVDEKLAQGGDYVIRQKVPRDGKTDYEDLVYGRIEVENQDLDDSVLMKSDGIPTYNFAHVVDDHEMGITHVIRGSEFLSSTPKYVLLYDALGWERPTYIHQPPINKNAREKLSKRHGDATFEDLLEKGFLPEAIVNYIALLGWHPKDEREIFSLEELAKEFSLDGLGKSPAIFDIEKLKWMNGEYLRKMSLDEFHEKAKEYYGQVDPRFDQLEISKLLHERTEILANIPEQIGFLAALPAYEAKMFEHKKMKSTLESSKKSLEAVEKTLEELDKWEQENIKEALFGIVEELGVKTGTVLWPARVALSGQEFTPGGAIEIAFILGQEESLRRIQAGLDKL